MIEANPVKYYLAKFFFLAFALILWLIAATLLIQLKLTTTTALISLGFTGLGLALFYTFLQVNDKIKRVAIGKNKIVIIESEKNSRFSWPEVKSLKVVPVFKLYKLKLKGKKGPIYFFPGKNMDPAFDLLMKSSSRENPLMGKKKSLA